jgi:long-chain acyl-CoA synthetase
MAERDAIPHRLIAQASQKPDAIAYQHKVDGRWRPTTWRELADQVRTAARALIALGVPRGGKVAILGFNRPEWVIFDHAALMAGGAPAGIYTTCSPDEVQYIIHHSESRVVLVEDAAQLAKVQRARARLPLLSTIVLMRGAAAPAGGDVLTWEAFLAQATGVSEAALDERLDAIQQADLATLIYTSGTTGPPKGVMISQYNVVFTADSLFESIEDPAAKGWRVVSYLPMAHIAERMTSHYRGLIDGLEVFCCPDPNQLMPYLKEVHPQMVFGVPRVFEKIYAGVNAALGADPEKKQQFDDGVAAAIEIKRAERDGTVTDEQLETWKFLDAVAFSAVRGLVGLDECELAITGAAPIPAQILEWFNAIGVNLAEIYGLSETTGPMTFSPLRNKPGWVGQAVPGCEVELAADGEVICRGGNVFQGYMGMPDKTAEALQDGWFHSGDIGEIDDEGYVRIVDRKKELIITSGGKNISPANLEAALKMIPIVGQACAIGDQRKYCSALLVLDPEVAPVWAAKNGKDAMSVVELAADPEVIAAVQAGVDEINQQFAQVEQIKKFVLVGEEWLPDSDMLTPTSKLKRRGVNARYAAEIESMYADA